MERLEKELADLKTESDALKVVAVGKAGGTTLTPIREEIETTKVEIEQAELQYDLNRAAELKYGKLTSLEKKLAAEEESWSKTGRYQVLKEEVDRGGYCPGSQPLDRNPDY